jgi:predicted permease
MAGVLLIQSAMPSAVLTYLVGSMYSEKRAVDNIASVIVSSTLMSFITIPIVVYLSLKFFN